jgi:hypothetical protein
VTVLPIHVLGGAGGPRTRPQTGRADCRSPGVHLAGDLVLAEVAEDDCGTR